MDAVLAEGILESFTGPGLGWIGGGLLTLTMIITILLMRNMNKRIKRLPETFGDTDSAPNSDALRRKKQDAASGEEPNDK